MAIHPSAAATSTSDTAHGPRWLAWLPWGAVAVLAALVTLTVLITDNSATITEPAYPSHQLDDPIAPWIFVYGWPAIWFGVLVLITVQFARSRVLSMPAILFLAGTTMFWIEWPADWGSYLVYNRDFWTFSGWTSTWYQTYWKPVGVIFGYGVFFGAEALILLHVVPRAKAALQRLMPNASPTALLVASCLATFYVVDILGERLMTAAGWYSYVEPVGWAWTSDRGSISWVWPALPFLLFAVAITLTLRADERGFYPNEKLFRINQLRPGPQREFARLAVWIVTMNVAIFIAQPLILVLGRILLLHDSVYVP
jgi:hypothetical protein